MAKQITMTSDLIEPETMDFWLESNSNVLMVGLHGVGKTALIKECMDRNNVYCKYYSAPTLDPWCDFIGIPKPIETEEGSYIDYVLPKDILDDRVEAFFFDELSRAYPKVQNAVMELVQFGSINGRKFKNLRVVWAAINPAEEDELAQGISYNVETLDKALEDRFEVIWEVPYIPDRAYFYRVYGKQTGKAAISWWNKLNEDQKKHCSPRRLEYAIQHFMRNGDLKHIFPATSGINTQELVTVLDTGPIQDRLQSLFNTQDVLGARRYLSNTNRFHSALPEIIKDDEWTIFFLPLIDAENLTSVMAEEEKVVDLMVQAMKDHPHLADIVANVNLSNGNSLLAQKINFALNKHYTDDTLPPRLKEIVDEVNKTACVPYYNSHVNPDDYWALLESLEGKKFTTNQSRRNGYAKIRNNICETLDKQLAEKTLQILSSIFAKVKSEDIGQLDYPNFAAVVNHVFLQMHRNLGWDWEKTKEQVGPAMKVLINKIKNMGMNEWFFWSENWDADNLDEI